MDTVVREVAAALRARVSKARGGTERRRFVLDVALEFRAGITIIFGPSGAGKSTLLDGIAGLVPPDSGRISVGDEVWFDSSQGINMPVHQRQVGYVFQELALFPHLSVEENIGYGIAHLAEAEKKSRIDEIMKAFRVEGLRKQKPGNISGGEAQRVELARALVAEPRVLLLDEPMSGLDEELKAHIMEDLRAWRAAKDIPILYVTHSKSEAQALGEHLVTMRDGVVVES